MSTTSTGRHADRWPEGQQGLGGPAAATAREPEPEVSFDPEATAVTPAVEDQRGPSRPAHPAPGATPAPPPLFAPSGPAGSPASSASPASSGPGDQRQVVTCPECGTTAEVALHRRRADDFCRRCDYPLFWTPSVIVSGDDTREQDGLRRLPGTAGRVAVASRACPHCAESNQLSAVTCVRCGGEMDPPPPAQPVYVAPVVVPEPEPLPPEGIAWWVWVGLAITLGLLVAVVLVLVL